MMEIPHITREELASWFKVQRALAVDRVRHYAASDCPLVPAPDVDTVCQALGDIGVVEALDFLDKRQRELTKLAGL